MSLSHSPQIVTNGLVFAYDMSNTKKSWKGRPVINQFAIPTPAANGDVGFQVNGTGTFRRIFSGTYGGYDIGPNDIVYRYDLGATGCHYHGNDVTINAGQTATWSFDYYVDPSVTGYPSTNYLANFEGVIGGSAGDPTPTQIGVWKRITFTGTAGSTGTCRMLLYPGACGDRLATSGFVLFKNPQVEFDAPGNNPSPFVAGTRSNTQAIIDLVGNNIITANSLTYNSDGTFSFNQSTDCIDINNTALITGTNPFTIEAAVYVNNASGGQAILGNYGSGYTSNSLWFATHGLWINGAALYFPSGQLPTGYHIIAVTRDAVGNVVLYKNGEAVATAVNTASIASNINWRIGKDVNGDGEPFGGKIFSVKVYNRALAATEVKQNFNALRGRYGV